MKKERRRDKIKLRIKEEIRKTYRYKRIIVSIISLIILLLSYLTKDASSFILRYSTFVGVIVVFSIIDHLFDVRFQLKHYFFVIIIAGSALLLSHLYFLYPQYDKLQHFFLPILLCSIIFFMVNKLNIALKWKITFTMMSVVALLGIFEIGEYVLDLFFNLKLQGVYLRDLSGLEKFNLIQNPLDDTMADLSFGLLGSSLYSLYAWLKHHKKIFSKDI